MWNISGPMFLYSGFRMNGSQINTCPGIGGNEMRNLS